MMAKATTGSHSSPAPVKTAAWKGQMARPLDWRKRMSDTVAYALLVYTALQILVTMHVMSQGNASTLPMFALVVLVAAIIPLFRHYERHWEGLDDAAAASRDLAPLFRRDQLSVWLFAVGLPFAVTGLFRLFA
jgi:hypothetical protein